MRNWLYRVIKCGSMPHLSRYHTLHVAMREMRIWPPDAAKCCKNAGKFFPDEVKRGKLSARAIIDFIVAVSIIDFLITISTVINLYYLIGRHWD